MKRAVVPYARLHDRLADPPTPTLSTLPDGSVDRYCTLDTSGTDAIRTRGVLADEMGRDGRSTFRIGVESEEPGGQAVNVATQLHALGSDVTCYGYLDAPLFDGVPFATVSMGEPSVVYAFNFDDGDVMLAENRGITDWSLASLRGVADLTEVFGVDAVACGNWVSAPGMDAALRELGGMSLPRVPFVLDPGDLVGAPADEIEAFGDALAKLQDTFDVVYNANRAEIRATAAALADAPVDDAACLAALREATGVTATVIHAADVAMAATPGGVVSVESVGVAEPARHTGGGDHFTGGLTFALAAGWDWDLALACGNACAAGYVDTATTGSLDDVRAVAERAAGAD